MYQGVTEWWVALCILAAFNICAWAAAAVTFEQRQDPEFCGARRRQLELSGAYVIGCAFRSALPVYDVPRICLFDFWLSSVIVGRSVATLAELCFVMQWALMLKERAQAAGSSVAANLSRSLVPLIAIAEVCSWYSVLTTSNVGHVVEESLWGLSAALLVAGILTVLPRSPPVWRPILTAWCLAGAAYVVFMFLVDVPTYWLRWLADEASGRHYLSILQGIADAASRRTVSYRWGDWKTEVAWMSLYFSVGVWASIWLIHAPKPPWRRRSRERQASRVTV
jgi:hypothetical protein